ncbi:uncharacterized protein ASPGLDRAFT_26174 [Aspergillus glaucus CBS 516.65]|uniref:Uncharacterized protein n=1 Tax=Aspergillus glaucus CBS 516.65 TaxID=1160497 RepID=A0A1L9VJ99_ASPGL|nr:hypothetical protein ASPGLDRAFT_26174 [Aspergillus glaucus CBS 516.65]OJJ83997.1 hypothetical protein ASPGLDRAFT_26174 [Aspergillus glaucus CBS 516.65]
MARKWKHTCIKTETYRIGSQYTFPLGQSIDNWNSPTHLRYLHSFNVQREHTGASKANGDRTGIRHLRAFRAALSLPSRTKHGLKQIIRKKEKPWIEASVCADSTRKQLHPGLTERRQPMHGYIHPKTSAIGKEDAILQDEGRKSVTSSPIRLYLLRPELRVQARNAN